MPIPVANPNLVQNGLPHVPSTAALIVPGSTTGMGYYVPTIGIITAGKHQHLQRPSSYNSSNAHTHNNGGILRSVTNENPPSAGAGTDVHVGGIGLDPRERFDAPAIIDHLQRQVDHLHRQVHGLNDAFGTISEVLKLEVDCENPKTNPCRHCRC